MLAYTSSDLNTIFRREVRDPLEGTADEPDSENLWSELEVYQYMTEAFDRVSKEVGGRYKIYQLAVVANQPLIYLPRAVLDIRTARLLVAGVPVLQANADQFLYERVDDYGRNFLTASEMFTVTGSPPIHFIRDYELKQLRLVPIPAANDTLEIQCTTTDTVPYDAGMPLPLMDTEDQRLVLTWMKYLAYMKHDADTEDLVRARYYEKTFEDRVILRAADFERQHRAPTPIRMDW